MDIIFTSDDGTVSETHGLIKTTDRMAHAASQVGVDLRVAPKLATVAREAGFENVKCEAMKLPMGPWARDRRLKMVGMCHREQFLQGLDGIVMGLFTRILQWTREEVEVYLTQVRSDIADRKCHGYWRT